MNPWLALAVAIVLEVSGTVSMKLSDGFTRLAPSVLIFIFYGASFAVLTLALKKIDLGVAYAVWAGVGTALNIDVQLQGYRRAGFDLEVLSKGCYL